MDQQAWHGMQTPANIPQSTPAWPGEGMAQVADQAEHAASEGAALAAPVAVVAGQAKNAASVAAAAAGVAALAAPHQACPAPEALGAAWGGLAAPCR